MIVSAIIAVVIAVYVVWVVCHKIQQLREGKYCCGECDGCSKSCAGRKNDQ
ncbi:FeoB-associated Cys-rich membrane protein [Frisingicoccus sp.]|uniref:FeoB-associated Cys-rich membrane protein n=1 Tax=Frisingicoccus sp. TaxID=1918627 RepID=UPI002EB1274A|nr:FeoB-associated Cys-rich membrane protein [Frisingicoccus sp.]